MLTKDILLQQLTDAQRRNLEDVTREAINSNAPVVDIAYDIEYGIFYAERFYHPHDTPSHYSVGDCDTVIGITRIINRHL